MKTIKSKDVTLVLPKDIAPGMILAEGIVYETQRYGDGTYFLRTPEASVVSGEAEAVQVYGRLAEALVLDYVQAARAGRVS